MPTYEPLLDALLLEEPLENIRVIVGAAPPEQLDVQRLFHTLAESFQNDDVSCPAAVFEYLISWKPECAFVRDRSGYSLMDYAVNPTGDDGGDTLVRCVDVELIRLLITVNPQSVRERDCAEEQEYFPLHKALWNRPPLVTVELLVDNFPEAVHIPDPRGNLPLNIACEKKAPIDVVSFLVIHHPEAVHMTDAHGDLPLHLACRSGMPANVVSFLATRYPQGLRTAGARHMLPIHCACKTSSWLTYADVVVMLLNGYPQGARGQDDRGRLPLHWACHYKNWDAAHILIAAYPAGVRTRDSSGALPIHEAFLTSVNQKLSSLGMAENIPVDLFRNLIEIYPQSIRAFTSNGWLPLHCGCFGLASVEVLQQMLAMYPEAINLADGNGSLPLHLVCQNRNASVDHVQLLVRANPLHLFRRRHDGNTPLRLAHPNAVKTYGVDLMVFGPRSAEFFEFLLPEQDRLLESLQEAVEVTVGELLGIPDEDTVVAKIWEFAKPDVWTPPVGEHDE